MAAYCTCCGAEITLKAEACSVCGTPRHGMLPSNRLLTLDIDTDLSQEDIGIEQNRTRPQRSPENKVDS